MKLLLIMNDNIFKPFGGLGVFVHMLAKQLYKFGVEIQIIGGGNDVGYCEYYTFYKTENYLNYYDTNERRSFSTSKLIAPYNVLPLINTIQNPDIVHSMDLTSIISGTIISKYFNIPHVTSVHLSYDQSLTNNKTDLEKMVSDLQYKLLLDSNLVINISKYYQSVFNTPNSVLIPNGIELNTCNEKIILPSIGRKLKVLYIGRYTFNKNVHKILQATIPDQVEIYFAGGAEAGNPDIFNDMIRYCEENDYAHYLGYYDNVEKYKLYNSVDAVLFPVDSEPFGLVGLEALSKGKILLSTSCSHYINSNDLLASNSVEDINAALNRLIMLTPEQINNISKKSAEIANMYDIQNTALSYLFHYTRLLTKY